MRRGQIIWLLAILAIFISIDSAIITCIGEDNSSTSKVSLSGNNSSVTTSLNQYDPKQENAASSGENVATNLLKGLKDYSYLIPYLICIVASLTLLGNWLFIWRKKQKKQEKITMMYVDQNGSAIYIEIISIFILIISVELIYLLHEYIIRRLAKAYLPTTLPLEMLETIGAGAAILFVLHFLYYMLKNK